MNKFENKDFLNNNREDEQIINLAEIKNYDFKDEIVNKFLEDQFDLPLSERSITFKEFIKQKKEEARQQEKIEFKEYKLNDTIEKSIKLGYEKYLKDFELNGTDLKDKKILDLGYGHGDFILYCLENKISDNVYGIEGSYEKIIEDFKAWDKNAELENTKSLGSDYIALFEKWSKNFFENNYFKGALQTENNDYVLSNASISLYNEIQDELKINNLLGRIIDSLKEGGEARIRPIFRGFKEDQEKYINWKELATKICLEKGINYSLKPQDISFGEEDDVFLRELLILFKEKE